MSIDAARLFAAGDPARQQSNGMNRPPPSHLGAVKTQPRHQASAGSPRCQVGGNCRSLVTTMPILPTPPGRSRVCLAWKIHSRRIMRASCKKFVGSQTTSQLVFQ